MSFCKKANHSGSDGNLNLLYGGKDEYAQLFIETIEAHYLGEMGTWLECVLLPIRLHQSPIACQAEVADGVECILGFFIILYKKPPLLKNVYLLLKREQLLRISHNRINKNVPPWYAAFLADEKRWRVLLSAKVHVFSQISKYFGEKVHK